MTAGTFRLFAATDIWAAAATALMAAPATGTSAAKAEPPKAIAATVATVATVANNVDAFMVILLGRLSVAWYLA